MRHSSTSVPAGRDTRLLDPINPSDTTIFFGAGVTRAAGGPTAAELVESIANALIRDRGARRWVCENIQPRGELRFETAIEQLSWVADPELKVLDLFETLKPGHLHGALAGAAAGGARLVTVNFDDLVEQAIGHSSWTVDLQEGVDIGQAVSHTAVVKLHGTQRIHRGGGGTDEGGSARLQATIASIVSAGGGTGLRRDLEAGLRVLVDERVLVVAGYSGSDDLDVMPSLQRCRPDRVVWIQHSDGPARLAQSQDLTSGSQHLLEAWRAAGIHVDGLAGPTDELFTMVGWRVPPPLDPKTVEQQRRSWREHVTLWATEAAAHDPTGLAWTGGMQATLARFDLAAHSLKNSQPSTRRGGLWPQSRRAFTLAENAYLRGVSRGEVRQLAKAATAAADAEGDAVIAACSALHVLARTHRTANPPDLSAAGSALDQAAARLQSVDAPGLWADLEVERARIAIASGDYTTTAGCAARAATNYRREGQFERLSEALQVRSLALTFNCEFDEARTTLAEARDIAHAGPYPERQIAAAVTAAVLADHLGRIDEVVDYAQAAISAASKTGHTIEIAQDYAILGLARIEQGRFADAELSFRAGIDATGPSAQDFLTMLVCGLATSLLRQGRGDDAQHLLAQHRRELEQDAGKTSYVRLLQWAVRQRCGDVAWDDEILDDAPSTGEFVFALAALAPPSERVRTYLDSITAQFQRIGQHERLQRLEALIQD